jgi:hypothetical protein
MIVGHLSGIPVEETLLQLAPAGAAMVSLACVAARDVFRRRRPWRGGRRPPRPGRP